MSAIATDVSVIVFHPRLVATQTLQLAHILFRNEVCYRNAFLEHCNRLEEAKWLASLHEDVETSIMLFLDADDVSPWSKVGKKDLKVKVTFTVLDHVAKQLAF